MIAKWLWVGLGGCLGAWARYGLSGLVHRYFQGTFPLGTMIVNILGCFLIGSIMASVQERPFLNENMRVFLLVGCLGAFTTFSTFGYETLELLRLGSTGYAAGYVAGNLLVGLAAVWAGNQLFRLAFI